MIKPILFNTDMVLAILDRRKTATRRICKDANERCVPDMSFYDPDKRTYAVHNYADIYHTDKLSLAERTCPICPGDILYVRETWGEWDGGYVYKAWQSPFPQAGAYPTTTWHPSIHMPKEAARIWLKVTDVRVERLQDINGKGCIAEGVEPEALEEVGEEFAKGMFHDIWDSTIKKNQIDVYGWDADPWVWVIGFERHEKPEVVR